MDHRNLTQKIHLFGLCKWQINDISYLKLLNFLCRQAGPIFLVQNVQIFGNRPQSINRPINKQKICCKLQLPIYLSLMFIIFDISSIYERLNRIEIYYLLYFCQFYYVFTSKLHNFSIIWRESSSHQIYALKFINIKINKVLGLMKCKPNLIYCNLSNHLKNRTHFSYLCNKMEIFVKLNRHVNEWKLSEKKNTRCANFWRPLELLPNIFQ